jgi:hypothetical protein
MLHGVNTIYTLLTETGYMQRKEVHRQRKNGVQTLQTAEMIPVPFDDIKYFYPGRNHMQ